MQICTSTRDNICTTCDIRNIQAGTKFKTLDQLKAKWDNMKTTAKSRSDALKKHLNKTGASPDPNLVLTAEEKRVWILWRV